ncbi:MAG: hypothetical protein ACO25B_01880 [Chitinophagaceae bacterium]
MTDDPNDLCRPVYPGKLNEALQGILIRPARFSNTGVGMIYLKVGANSSTAVACVVTIDKR